ncbi:MAG: hypothetical protein HYX32_08515 [Actinobacteria bacterium]|nr:hypothetical protein [Actinomycetota bacterium]
MRYSELTREEQNKIRRLWRDTLHSIDLQPFRGLTKVLSGSPFGAFDDEDLRDELRGMRRQLEVALTSDFELEPWMEHRMVHDRETYMQIDPEFGEPPADASAIGALSRRIHHQRIELRQLQRILQQFWQWRAGERARQDEWWKRQQGWSDEPDEACSDTATLRRRLRLQRRALRHANRLIEEQQREMAVLLNRTIVHAATG